MRNYMKNFGLMVIFAAIALSSCRKENPEDRDHSRREFISLESIGDVNLYKIRKMLGESVYIDSLAFGDKLKYDVSAYKLSYYTLYEDSDIVPASALVLVPKGVSEYRLAAVMHGTVVPFAGLAQSFHIGVPSTFDCNNGPQDVREMGLPIASSGFCVVMPDYTGYGPTKDRDHAFVYFPELFKSAYDGVVCARDALMDRLGKDVGKDLWICGWSQGAGLSLFMQKELENNPEYAGQFNLKAVSCVAGPFNVKRFVQFVFAEPDKLHTMIMLYSWTAYAVNRFAKGLQRKMDQIFRNPIYDQVDAFMVVGSSAGELFTDFFLKNIMNGSDDVFIRALEEDSTVIDRDLEKPRWVPVAPLYLHHGTADSWVPSFNSVNAYNVFRRHGADVSLYLYEGQEHTTFIPSFTSKTIDEFHDNL